MKKILVVEDEKILRDAYVHILGLEGFGVDSAENGKIALAKLEKFRPDLVLLDILMPVMDGLEFLEAAQLKLKYPKIKVIAFSNLSDQSKLDGVYELGVMQHFLKSSMSPKELVMAVRKVLK